MPKRVQTLIAVCVFSVVAGFSQPPADSDHKLASDFWAWRARTGQYTGDDVTRMERPLGVVRDWSAGSIEKQRDELAAFEDRWRRQDNPKAPVPQQVDHRLIGSDIGPGALGTGHPEAVAARSELLHRADLDAGG